MAEKEENCDNKAVERPSSSDDSLQAEEEYGISERSLLRKLDRKLLPIVSILYLLSFLDRSNGMMSRWW